MARGTLPPLALVYHGVADVSLRRDPEGLFVRPQDLRRHVARLREWGYRLVTFGDLAELVAESRGEGHAAITFDDGFVDNLETVVPILAELGAPATVFVVSGWLGRAHPSAPWTRVVTAEELRRLRGAGVEIGGHSATHADLSALPYEDAREELARGKRELEQELGEPVEVAAYPYGRANEETVRACRDAGFRAACAATGRGSWEDPHFLPRQDMAGGSTLLGLRLKRDNRYETLLRLAPARAARRISRRMRAGEGAAEMIDGLLRPAAVLAYHGVGSPVDDPDRLLVAPERLESHVRFLQRIGYRFLTAEELLDEGRPPPRTAVLTFDDGFRNWMTDAVPLLRRLGVRATFYVCPGLFGRQHWHMGGDAGRLLDESEARGLVEAGMELGSHSFSHPDLRLVDGGTLSRELEESKRAVEQVTGRPCRTLAYPYGLYDERVTQAAAAAGYELAFGWLPGPWRPLAAPRLPAPPRDGPLGLSLKLHGLRRRKR